MQPKEFCCPTCGAKLDKDNVQLKVDLTSNTLIAPKGSVHLTPIQAKLAFILISNMPNFVHVDRIYSTLWDGRGDHYPLDMTLRTHVSKLRKLIGPLGIKIEAHTGCGYRIVEEKENEHRT